MFTWTRRNWRWAAPLGAAVLTIGLWLSFGYFGVHTLFFDNAVDEAAPTFTTPETTATPATQAPTTTTPEGSTRDTSTVPTSTTMTTTTTTPSGPLVLAEGTFIDRSHPTSGISIVLGDGAGQRVLRFEDFRTDNGPDLFVYLTSAPADAPARDIGADFVDLGVLRGNVGAQNYEIPIDVDLDTYSTVVIWCRRFAVAFGSADLET